MKYGDIIALLHANSNLKATRKAWNNQAFIMMEDDKLMIFSKPTNPNSVGFIKLPYNQIFQDITANDWEIIP